VIVLDTSGLMTAYGFDQSRHKPVTEILRQDSGPLVLSPFVLAELDYMLVSRLGPDQELTLLEDVTAGVYQLAEFGLHDVAQAKSVVERYRALNVGLADASIVVLAAQYQTTRILTFDHRHFRAMTPLQGGSFTLLPADEAG
jgi:uncharacterized protein